MSRLRRSLLSLLAIDTSFRCTIFLFMNPKCLYMSVPHISLPSSIWKPIFVSWNFGRYSDIDVIIRNTYITRVTAKWCLLLNLWSSLPMVINDGWYLYISACTHSVHRFFNILTVAPNGKTNRYYMTGLPLSCFLVHLRRENNCLKAR